MTRKCFLTHRGHWITREQLLINDNPNTPEDLLSQSAIHFWNVPSNCLPKVQVLRVRLTVQCSLDPSCAL